MIRGLYISDKERYPFVANTSLRVYHAPHIPQTSPAEFPLAETL
jgi:hypothetical protein